MKKFLLLFVALCAVCCFAAGKKKSSPLKTVSYPCSYDNSMQKALVWFAKGDEPRPLVVALHTWSCSYHQGEPYARQAVKYNFHVISPNFRGPNTVGNPESMGSDAAISDIVSAVNWMKKMAKVDEERIYLVGGSGGGHMALLMAGRHPEIWAAVSAWCPITDLKAWCEFHKGEGYGKHIIDNLKGDPRTDDRAAKEAARRSPVTWLANAKGVNIDIGTGINDGHRGSVPITETLNAFNVLAAREDRIPAEDIALMRHQRKVPAGTPAFSDPGYGKRKIHYRKVSGNARVTIFAGAHNILADYSYSWFKHQKKGQPAVWKSSDTAGKMLELTK